MLISGIFVRKPSSCQSRDFSDSKLRY